MPRYRTKLNDKDFKLLKKEGMGILGETGHLFPIFGNHIEDFVKFNVYGLDDTYLKSGISEDFENDDNNIKLKPGNDLRKMGFTRGDYKVKYFFYRRLAGADEIVLTKTVGDQSGVVHSGNPKLTGEPMGDFYVDDDGKVFQGNGPAGDGSEPSELDVKEYKFFVDKISANKKEVRLAPQSINLDKYKDEFSSLYIPDGVYKPVSGIGDFTDGGPTVYGGAKFNSADNTGFKFVTKNGTDLGFLKKYVGGTLEIENAYIVGYTDQVPAAEENSAWSLEDPIPPITIEINYPDNNAITDTPVIFTAKRESGNVAPSQLSYYWDFGCGHEEFGTPEISHIYTISGIMNVSLVVNSPNFSDTITMDPLQITMAAAEESTDDTTIPEILIPLSSELDGKIIGWNGIGTAPFKNAGSQVATKGYPYGDEWDPIAESVDTGNDTGIGAPHMQNDTLWYVQSGHRRWIGDDRNIRTFKLLKPGASLFVADVDGDGNDAPEHDELRVSSYVINQLPIGPDITENTFTNVGDNPSTLPLDEPIYEGGVTGGEGTSLAEYLIAVQAGSGGTVSDQGGATIGGYFQEGTTISLHSTANGGYNFTIWTDSSGQNEFTNITNTSTQLVVKADATITAVFAVEPPIEYNITLTTDGSGTVVSNPTSSPFIEGTQVEISALAYDGYQFAGWTDSSGQNTISAPDSDTSFSAQASGTITANFVETVTHTITVSAGSDGQVRIDGDSVETNVSKTVVQGSNHTIQAYPNANWRVQNWAGDGAGWSGTYNTISNIQSNKSISVTFSVDTSGTSSSGTQSGSCFARGTQIQMHKGVKSIEEVEIGDIVKSFDVGTSSVVDSKVTKTFVHSDRYYMIINGIIKTTSVHPFYTDGKWVEAGDLSIGDKILHVDGLEHTIDSIEEGDEVVDVYNLEVDGTHNYFAEGYLVHNK